MDLNRYQALLEAGGQHLTEGRRGEAAKAFADADAMATEASQPPLRIGPVMALIHLAELDQNLETASTLAELLVKLATISGAVQYVFVARLLRLQHLFRLERFDEALESCPATFESARTFGDEGLEERFSHVYTLRGRVLLGLGRAKDAAADFREALTLRASNSLELRIFLAQAQVRSRDRSTDLAIELEECLAEANAEEARTSPSEPRLLASLALAELRLARGELQAAQRTFDALNIPRGPTSDPAVAFFGAELAIAAGRFSDALEWLGEGPLSSRLELTRVRALAGCGFPSKALVALSRVIARSDEFFVEATLMRADLLLKMDSLTEGRELARSVAFSPTSSAPTRARALVILARERIASRDLEQARHHYDAAFRAALTANDHPLMASIGIEGLPHGLASSPLEGTQLAVIQSADLRLAVEFALVRASVSLAAGRRDEARKLVSQARIESAGEPYLTQRVDSFAAGHDLKDEDVDSVH